VRHLASSLSTFDRSLVHYEAKKHGLDHDSEGNGSDRHVVLSFPIAHLQSSRAFYDGPPTKRYHASNDPPLPLQKHLPSYPTYSNALKPYQPDGVDLYFDSLTPEEMERQDFLRSLVEDFAKTAKPGEVRHLSSSLSTFDRSLVHNEAKKRNLDHDSEGSGSNRHVVLTFPVCLQSSRAIYDGPPTKRHQASKDPPLPLQEDLPRTNK
jgi:hypothetical protein